MDAGAATAQPPIENPAVIVVLNATRAAEEADGRVRWLRPEYQGGAGAPRTLQASMELTAPGAKQGKGGNARRSAGSTKAPWLTSLAERVATTERALKSTHAPVTAAELAKTFTRAKTEDLAEILETLATLGRAHRDGEKYSA